MIGQGYVGTPLDALPRLDVPGISDIAVIGPIVFGQDILVYLSFAMVGAVIWFLYHTRGGLVLRAVGESHDAAHAIGYPVIAIRYLAVVFGGAMAGIGGAYLSLAYTPMWIENMTAGRGWIALALVVFATWRPGRVLLGAYLFGGVTILQAPRPGGRARHRLPASVDAALSGDHPGPGADLARPDPDPPQRPGGYRQNLPARDMRCDDPLAGMGYHPIRPANRAENRRGNS